ncbi:hypothetical protein PGSY75_1436400 [Plasmodium gaboni]|uniref:Uncharacterized protein n=1 Tax=Plasmodium gaboni TaxID=647221 RepID=A0A151LAG7_9APIC|nr:hypothetical protein PGSY75_1436400 [Plasmodium gaboni]KYN95960.1 hypothetical protein PGSY75_1436400 [Plasmodium gaboni]
MLLKNILKGQVNYKNASYINIEKDINNKINKILNLIVYDVNKKKNISCSYIIDYIKYMNKHVYKLKDEQDLIPDSKDNVYIQWKYYNNITVNVLKEYVKKCHRNNIDCNYNYEKKKKIQSSSYTTNDTSPLITFNVINNYAATKEKEIKHDMYYDKCNNVGNKNVSYEKNIIKLQTCQEDITCEIQNDNVIDNHMIYKMNNIQGHICENYVKNDKNILNNSSYIYYNISNLNYIKYMWLHHSLVIFKLLIDTNLKVDIKRQFNMTKIIVSLLKQLNNSNSNSNNNNNIIDVDLYLSYFYLLSKINMIDKHMVIQLCTFFKKDYKNLSDLNKFYLLRCIYNFDYSSKNFQQILNYLQKYFYTLIKKHYLENNTYYNYDNYIHSKDEQKEISSKGICYNIGSTQKEGEKTEISILKKYTNNIITNSNVNESENIHSSSINIDMKKNKINNINYSNSDDAYNNADVNKSLFQASYKMFNTDMSYQVLSKKKGNKNSDNLFFHNYLLEIFEVLFKRKKHISLLDRTIFKCVVNQEVSIYNKINLDLFKNIVKLCDEELIFFLFNKIIQDIENYDNLEIYHLLTYLKKYDENNSLFYFYKFFHMLKEKQFEYMNIKHVIYIYIYINRYLNKEFKKQQKKKMKDLISININDQINEIYNVDNMINMLNKKSDFTSQYEYIYTFLNSYIYNINNYDNKGKVKKETDYIHNVEIFNNLLNEDINQKDDDIKKDNFCLSEDKSKVNIKNQFMCIELLNDINKNITTVLTTKINYINIKNIITLLYNTCQIKYEYQMNFVMNLFFHLYEEYYMLINFSHVYKILFQNFLFYYYYYDGTTEYMKEIYDANKGEHIYMDKRNNHMMYKYENKMKQVYNYINRRYFINEHQLYDINKFTILLNIYEKFLLDFINYNIYKCSNIQNEKINEKDILKNSFFVIYIYTHLQYIIFNKKKNYNDNIPLNNIELIFKYSKQIIKKINIYLKSNIFALGYIQNMNNLKCNDNHNNNINNFKMCKHITYKFNNEVECNVIPNIFYEKNKFDISLFEKLEDKKFLNINISPFINCHNNKEYDNITNEIIPYNINNSILNFEYNIVPLFYHIIQYINYICTYIYFNTNTHENITIKESLIFISLICLKYNFNISNHNIVLMNNIYKILTSMHINDIKKNILFIISLDYIQKSCNVNNIVRTLFRSSKNGNFNYNFNINDICENTRCKILARYIKYLKKVHIS